MEHQYRYALAILTCLLVCGCGQKGPLFLPGDRSQVQTELPPLDRDSLEEAVEDDDEEGTRDVPDTERPPIEDDVVEPLMDPAAPRPKPRAVPDADQGNR
jgi:predicted small lipoprotein YifL